MPIPELNEEGLLPPGIHDCTIDELVARFGGASYRGQRSQLCRDFSVYVAELRATGVAQYLLVDGSFVTAAEHPNDIDLIVVAKASYNLTRRMRPDHYNIVSRKRVAKRYPFDVFFVAEGSRPYSELSKYFTQVRTNDQIAKGILRIQL